MKYVKIVILAAVCVGIAVGYYFYLSNHTGTDSEARKEQDTLSEVESLLTEDLESNYPPTPREVVKYYNRILVCCYNEECEDEQIDQMVKMMRLLLDDELLQENSEEEQIEALKADISVYHTNEKKILDTTVSSSNEITMKEVNGEECAYVTSSYLTQTGTDSDKTYQEYVLRQNEDGEWKIIAFQLADGQ